MSEAKSHVLGLHEAGSGGIIMFMVRSPPA